MIRFIKGCIIGALFAVPAVYSYDNRHYMLCVGLLVCGAIGGILVDLEVI